jgi:hypothetical protein
VSNVNILDDVEDDYTPGTPVIKEGTRTSPTDPGEFLLGDEELDDNEDDITEDSEDEEDDD